MTSICVADNQLWLLWLNDGYHYECWSDVMDYMAYICMIIVWITFIYLYSLFIFITQIILIVFFGGSNHLYDV